jgi:hypothetical protein
MVDYLLLSSLYEVLEFMRDVGSAKSLLHVKQLAKKREYNLKHELVRLKRSLIEVERLEEKNVAAMKKLN